MTADLGREILEKYGNEAEDPVKKTAFSEQDKGSIMSILATDLPVTDRQLTRIIRRLGVGIARTGAYTGHGSGEVMIGFTTANRVPTKGLRREEEELRTLTAILRRPSTVHFWQQQRQKRKRFSIPWQRQGKRGG